MRRKKKHLRDKPLLASKLFISCVLIFFSIPLTIYLSQNNQTIRQNAQQTVMPTFGALAPCPECTRPTEPVISPGSAQNVEPTAAEQPTTINNPNQEPCSTQDTTSASDNKHSRANDGGLFQKMLQFIVEIFKKLIELLSGKSSDGPKSSLSEPSIVIDSPQKESPQEKPKEEPKAAPKEEPVKAPEQQQPCNPPSNEPSEVPEALPSPSSSPLSNAPSNLTSTDAPPSSDTCSGKYKLTNPRNQNFGDPQCNFDKNALYTQLKQADAANADIWFNEVVPCESSYNPNAYAGPATGTPDAGGAWGLFQMGQGKNGQYDHGDVAWGSQASNAVNYKNITIKGSWRYWACAKSHW